MTCIHYHREDPMTCDAFPERIPNIVWLEANPHDKPLPCDHGIQYEPDPAMLAKTGGWKGGRTPIPA
jgi:hypothetical protein